MQTYWIDGYKIAARSKSQALAAAALLKRSGVKPDYKTPSTGWALCQPNNAIPC